MDVFNKEWDSLTEDDRIKIKTIVAKYSTSRIAESISQRKFSIRDDFKTPEEAGISELCLKSAYIQIFNYIVRKRLEFDQAEWTDEKFYEHITTEDLWLPVDNKNTIIYNTDNCVVNKELANQLSRETLLFISGKAKQAVSRILDDPYLPEMYKEYGFTEKDIAKIIHEDSKDSMYFVRTYLESMEIVEARKKEEEYYRRFRTYSMAEIFGLWVDGEIDDSWRDLFKRDLSDWKVLWKRQFGKSVSGYSNQTQLNVLASIATEDLCDYAIKHYDEELDFASDLGPTKQSVRNFCYTRIRFWKEVKENLSKK